jgi:hypothetical protein
VVFDVLRLFAGEDSMIAHSPTTARRFQTCLPKTIN